MRPLPSHTFLFPGQGAYHPGALESAAVTWPATAQALREIDEIANPALNRSVQSLLLERDSPALQELLASDPDALQMAIYAAAIATYKGLASEGRAPTLLLGHSFGEIAALVAAGAFSIADGARIVLHRCAALKSVAGSGYMVALPAPASRCRAFLDFVGIDTLAIAVDNGNQTVVSGATEAMDRLCGVAQSLGMSITRLASPYPFHSPMLQSVSREFGQRLQSLQCGPLQIPVYSPILGRAYTADDDLAAALASHLTLPVRFADALRRPANAWAGSTMVFVEMGASNALCKLVKQVCGPKVQCHAPFASPATPQELEQMLRALDGQLPSSPSAARAVASEPTAVGTPCVATAEASASFSSRDELQQEIVQLFAQAMEYPPEVFTDDVQLEAELGIDSVKQMELLGKLEQKYRLPPLPADFRLGDYGTVRKIADLVFVAMTSPAPVLAHDVAEASPAHVVALPLPRDARVAAPDVASEPVAANTLSAQRATSQGEVVVLARTPAAPAATASRPLLTAVPAATPVMSREQLQHEIVQLFAETMEYPPEVFTDDVQLEAELGIDSVKQMELLGKLEQRYHLPALPEDFRLSDHGTVRKITQLIFTALTTGTYPGGQAGAAPVTRATPSPVAQPYFTTPA